MNKLKYTKKELCELIYEIIIEDSAVDKIYNWAKTKNESEDNV